jgi:hypothetical protein
MINTDVEKIVVNVTVTELTEILKNYVRGTFFYMVYFVIVRMNKTDNPYFGRVKKLVTGRFLMGNDYKVRVENKNGITDFVPEKCTVGEHLTQCVLHNENKGLDYLQYENLPNSIIDKEFILDETDPIEEQLFKSYEVKKSTPKYGVYYPSVTINNIKELHVDHYVYKVVDNK